MFAKLGKFEIKRLLGHGQTSSNIRFRTAKQKDSLDRRIHGGFE